MFTRAVSFALLVAVVGCARPEGQPGAPTTKASKDVIPEKGPPETKGGATDLKTPKVNAKDEPTAFEIRMVDDTVVKVVLLESNLSIVTKYGKLTVPANDVRRLEFGFRYPDGAEAKIDKGITDLGSSDFRTREDAEQTLAEIGKFALPALRRAARSEDAEVNRRAKAVIKLLEGKLPANQLEVRDHDVVETAEFTIKGRMDANTLKVRTKHFGDATVKLADIRTFRAVGSASAAEFALDASKYAKMTQSEWKETVLEVSSGQQLEVTASGRIDQWPQGPGQYMCGPEGQGGAGFNPGGVQRLGLPGQVIGRIGANGTPFAIGEGYKGKVTESGKLYLRIGGSPWNCESTGSYKVNVNVTTP